jgi:hypothetical protein
MVAEVFLETMELRILRAPKIEIKRAGTSFARMIVWW